MSTHFPPPHNHAELTQSAAAWLAALDAGTADIAGFEAWRDADVRHAVAFAEVAATWRDMDNLRLMQGAVPPESQPVAMDRSRRGLLRSAMGVAAMAALGGGFAYRAYARDRAATGIGEHRMVKATSDLSLDLNTDSCVYWKQGEPERVWLERGEVAIATGHGCELMTPDGRFNLAAGAYNARMRGEGCELAVLSGALSDEAGLHLGAGEIALLAGGRITLHSRDSADLSQITAWQSDTLVLNGESLDYALAEINRYLKDKIVIGDPALARIRLGGTFGTRNPAEFLQALHDSFGVRATTGAKGGIILTRI